MSPPRDVARDLEELRSLLAGLSSIHQSFGIVYPFEAFTIDDEWLELTGSIQGSVNHSLEVAFGNRADPSNTPIKLKSHGPDLVAVVDVLSHSIDGKGGENPILINWISDLKVAAISAYNLAQVERPAPTKRSLKSTEKREIMELETESRVNSKKQKVEEKERTEKAKARTEGKFNFDPANLREITAVIHKAGRKTLPILDKLTILCEVISDPSKKRWRCSGLGCPHSYADPRTLGRVQTHAMECQFLDRDLVEEASAGAANHSLGAQLEVMSLAAGSGGKQGDKQDGKLSIQPSVHAHFHDEGLKQRSTQYNHDALVAVCALSLPPSILDSIYWTRMIRNIDKKIERSCGSHISGVLIPAEAARAREKSIEVLKQHRHLTLSFDGATTRRNQSIYTIHATTPDTRQAHLLAGNEATGKSHTGKHIEAVLLKAMEDVGLECFSGVSSDSTGNTRLARELLATNCPWLIILPDPCHQMNNTAKDICDLEVFVDANRKMRIVIRFFRKSSYASHHLDNWRIILGVVKGLVSIGKTRFLTLYYAIHALIPCIPIIVQLIKTGVISVNPKHPLYWMRDKKEVRTFTDILTQEMSLLEPFARSVKCLESSASTPADVALFWLASLAVLHDTFTDSDKRDELMLTEDTITEVRSIVNGRYAEMVEGVDRQVYLSTLFLDFHYLSSTLFTRRQLNPLATTISLRPIRLLQSSNDAPTHDTPDSDIRATLPIYESIGAYLGKILVDEINSGRAPEVFECYEDSDTAIREFRFQFMNYVRQTAPFDRYLNSATALMYWKSLFRHADAQILAYLAIKFYSIVPNSMAEERTVSNFTKLNAPDRGRQKTSTLVFMTQVRQHQQRLLDPTKQAVAPTVRFRDLPGAVKSYGFITLDSQISESPPEPVHASEEPLEPTSEDEPENETMGDVEEADLWEQEAGFDEVIEQPPRGSGWGFEVAETEDLNLSEPALRDLLSDQPIPGVVARGARHPRPIASPIESIVATPTAPMIAKPFKF
ncbi:hypothetical protein BDV93DRAFT_608572 [Ceratobasidium sp. AG-I]|nr:hypothetical protein BDV93DRAFT_608572 [Ceratobasidium sp. AG-I]